MRILITGATDGLGLEAARRLFVQGHTVLLHGRDAAKLDAVEKAFSALPNGGQVERYLADLSRIDDVMAFADAVEKKHAQMGERLDVLINNAGVFAIADPLIPEGLDKRFVVNTIAPYLLTKRLLQLLRLPPPHGGRGRVVNLSSISQASVAPAALSKSYKADALDEKAAYAQSKRALTMWSCHLGRALKAENADTPVIVAVHPGARLATKMVREAYGVDGRDPGMGADVIVRAALSPAFADAGGRYYDNDAGAFVEPHPDVLDADKCEQMVQAIEAMLRQYQ